MGCRPIAVAPCEPGWRPSGPGWWSSAGPPTHPTSTEGLWASLKAVELANLTSPTLAKVIDQAHRGIQRVRQTPHLACSFLRHAGLSVS